MPGRGGGCDCAKKCRHTRVRYAHADVIIDQTHFLSRLEVLNVSTRAFPLGYLVLAPRVGPCSLKESVCDRIQLYPWDDRKIYCISQLCTVKYSCKPRSDTRGIIQGGPNAATSTKTRSSGDAQACVPASSETLQDPAHRHLFVIDPGATRRTKFKVGPKAAASINARSGY